VLHVAGRQSLLHDLAGEETRAVAIVGARRATPDGIEVARALGRGLAAAGVTVVSGMALGIDSAAHAGALEACGPTVAVLASGADVAYPRSKARLYRELVDGQCVVSEMPPGFQPFRWAFPARNRTIAALADVTVVVEATARSGSLITAEFAADFGRQVAAVPGRVTAPQAQGTNALIIDGAPLIRHARDVLDLLFGAGGGPPGEDADPRTALEPRLRSLLDAVESGRDTVSAIARTAGEAQAAMRGLTELELLGLVRRDLAGRYGRVLQ
jgi:DNA processing protein